ncbi:PEGA domain-containing protein [Pendulispora brunnea]|uniref:PEGA domain-containing protein n=1 Tax=Pendulispora brunnea TaxID=2905690 RepID=A0ABZ2K584_9BACT
MAALGALLAVAAVPVAAAQTAEGFLTVSSTPPAKVIIDDKDSGRSTPVENLRLPVGDHKLTLVNGNVKRTLGFTITAGQTTRLKIAL